MTKTSEVQAEDPILTDHLNATFAELLRLAIRHGEDVSSWSLNLRWDTRCFTLKARPQWPTVVTSSPAQMYTTMARRIASYQQWIKES